MMNKEGMFYTSARWNVKPGNEKEFVRTWKEFIEWSRKGQHAMIDAYLLQEADDPLRFMSFGSWESLEGIADWRKQDKFKEFLARLKDLCEEIQIRTLRAVVSLRER